MKKVIIVSAFAAMLMANGQYEVGVSAGRHNVSKSPMDNYNFLNVRVGKYLPMNHILRFELERSEDLFDGSDSLTRALVNMEHDFSVDNKITPYLFLGLGYQWVGGNYDDNVVADLGAGVKYVLDNRFDLFAEIRGLRDFGNNDNHYGAIFGVNYKFGEEKKVQPPKDSDKDGVIDLKDKCPGTPFNVKVDKQGCPVDSDRDGVADYLDKCPNTPEGVSVDSKGCEIDSDHDGVVDRRDLCPNTPEGIKVDVNGCPVDSDNDGVADYLDQCPNTPAGVKVNVNGCPVVFNFDITFDYNSAKIKPQYMKKVKEFAEFLKENPAVRAEIQGHTDNIGSEKYNQILSEKRAKAVYEALINLGISKERLTYRGYGESQPIASNATSEGRAKNRRVVAKIFY